MLSYVINCLSNVFFIHSVILLIEALGMEKKAPFSKKLAVTALLVIFSVLSEYCRINGFGFVPLLIYVLSAASAFLILFGKIKISHIYVTVIADCLGSFFSTVITAASYDIIASDILKPASLAISRAAILIIVVYFEKTQKLSQFSRAYPLIPKKIFVSILAVICSNILITTLNNYDAADMPLKRMILNILITISIMLTMYIVVTLIINVITRQHSAYVVSLLQNQIDLQLSHYEKLEKLSGEMRSFRHDYINHLHSVLSLIQMSEYDDAEKYIGKLLEIKDAPAAAFNSGNRLADAILTDKSESCGKDIRISLVGMIPAELDNVDLCTVLSNALDNAIEACRRCGGGNIDITAGEKQGYFVITVKNPTDSLEKTDGIPATTKKDRENHGFGLLSIEQAAKKHDGAMTVHSENGVFELSAVFKIC